MTKENLTRMTDTQLRSRFATSAQLARSGRAKEIINEMEQCGFIDDLRRGEFITCA